MGHTKLASEFPIVLNDMGSAEEPLFLCIWEGGAHVEIHTEESLRRSYASTNLFTEEADRWTPRHGDSPFEPGARITTFDVLRYMINEEPEDLRVWGCDNMTIQRINTVRPKPSPGP